MMKITHTTTGAARCTGKAGTVDDPRRRAARRFRRRATAVAALLMAGVLQAAPASADVYVGSGVGHTNVRCGGGLISLTGQVTPHDGMPVMIAETLWTFNGNEWVYVTRDWTQVYSTYNLTLPAAHGSTHYVTMHYAFMTASGWVVQSEGITDYQWGAYNALPYCYA